MSKLKKGWQKVPRTIRRALVFMIGVPVVIAGLIMLVTPGPGWAGIFLGFAILASEFAFAEKVRDWLVRYLKNIIKWLTDIWQSRPREQKIAIIVLTILVILAILCIIYTKYIK